MTFNTPHIEKWEKCLRFFKDNVSESQYATWFEPLVFLGYTDNVVTLGVASMFVAERLDSEFINLIGAALKKEFSAGVGLVYKTNVVRNEPSTNVTLSGSRSSAAVMPRQANPTNPFIKQSAMPDTWLEPQLNPRYTFENYCGSTSNQVARSIGEAIASDPKCKTFNPLFVFGAPGVGKTHLMQAIGIRAKELFPQMRVLYITARLFQSQYTSAERSGKTNEFLNFYQSIDMLIVDDIQDLIGKPGTQNAFFHIFNHLHLNQKQLIMSSDCCPSAMEGMEARLLSRFKWGMTAELSSPDYELRRRVLDLKTRQDGVDIPGDVAEFIAANVTNSIREIEGIVVSLVAYSTVLNRPIDMELARTVMANAVKVSRKQVNFDLITEKVSEYYGLDPEKIFSKSRKREINDARQMVMYLAKKLASMPTTAIGTRLSRSHSTVIYACNQLDDRISVDAKLREEVNAIEALINA